MDQPQDRLVALFEPAGQVSPDVPTNGAMTMPGSIPGRSPHIAAERAVCIAGVQRRQFTLLQALEDAIRYRRVRVAHPCPDCWPGPDRCDDHACDLALIADYHSMASAVDRDISKQHQAIRLSLEQRSH
jgi:hypothetical protein